MKIGEVEKVTGLTSKAIRLYEEKGLISIDRLIFIQAEGLVCNRR